MIGLNISEKEYRALRLPSYSLLSDIQKIGPKAITAPPKELSNEEPIIIGSYVDKMLTDSKNVSDIYIVNNYPTAKPLEIIKILVDNYSKLSNTKKVFSLENKDIIMKVCDKFSYHVNWDARIKALSKFEDYFKVEMRKDKDSITVLSTYQKDQAERLVRAIKMTFPFFSEKNGLPQLKLVGVINGVKVKVMFDLVIIDDKNKRIVPFDLKTGIKSYTTFINGNYLDFNYYIQGGLYHEVLLQNIKGTKYENYKVEPFRFLYCGREDFLPQIFEMSQARKEEAFNGFYTKSGEYKKGINTLLDEYKYYKENPENTYILNYLTVKNGKNIPFIVF